MPSSNPRYADYPLRVKTRKEIIARVLAGEPCALCHRPINLDLPQRAKDPRDGKIKPTPWALEVDEIIPISQGGLPYGENCQPAHRICNQLASNKKKKARPTAPRADPATSIEL